MIKIENYEIVGLEHAIRGMRNPMNSWDKSDSEYCSERSCIECPNNNENGVCGVGFDYEKYVVGPNDLDLMKRLAAGGPVHAKYRRMIVVYVDITAPLYWWKEFDTYKIGTVANSCSTMHKIHAKEFELNDFSHEHIIDFWEVEDKSLYMDDEGNYHFDNHPVIVLGDGDHFVSPYGILKFTISMLNKCRKLYLETKDKKYWWQMIQLLPSSYNQKRTVMLNYEVLNNIYYSRKGHKLDEWHDFCDWIEKLPYADGVIFGIKNVDHHSDN